jgi:hypothetical protein
LKASNFNYKNSVIWLLIVGLAVFAAACSDDETTNGPDQEENLDVLTIILSPKSAEPGDTVQATAVLAGSAQNFPSISWKGTGGTFLETNKTTVGWVAPTTTGVFRLTCTATGASASASDAADVFVGQINRLVNGAGGEINLVPGGDEFYYLQSPLGEAEWDSSDVWVYTGPLGPAASPARYGTQYVFNNDLTEAAHISFGESEASNTEDPINVWLIDLAAGTRAPVTADGSLVGGTRHQQYQHPAFSPNGTMLAYQAFQPHPELGEVDTIDVFVRYQQSGSVVNITRADTVSAQRRNLFPTFSSDNNWLVFVSDRNAFNVWEFYGLPVVGGLVDTTLASTVQMTDVGGMAGLGLVETVEKPVMAWNPDSAIPILAVVGADGLLYYVQTNSTGAVVTPITAFNGTIRGIAWSDDGTRLAVSVMARVETGGPTVNALYSLSTAGTATLLHAALVGDRIYDMVWSADNQFIVYRVTRSGLAWFELLDVGGSTNFLGPVVITPSSSEGSRSAFAAEMDVSARMRADGRLYMLLFDRPTPTISVLDLSETMSP